MVLKPVFGEVITFREGWITVGVLIWYCVIKVVWSLTGPELDPVLQVWLHQCWTERKRSLPLTTALDLLATLLLVQPGLSTAFFPAGAPCWLLLTLRVHQDPQVHSCQAAFELGSPQHVQCLGLFSPWNRTLLKPLMRFLSAHSSSLLRSLWMAAQPFGISVQHTCFGYIQIMIKISPSVSLWDTLLVTGLQLDFVSLFPSWAQLCVRFITSGKMAGHILPSAGAALSYTAQVCYRLKVCTCGHMTHCSFNCHLRVSETMAVLKY